MTVRMPGSGPLKKAVGRFFLLCGLVLLLLGTHSAFAQTQSYYYFFNNSYAPYTALSTGTKSLVNAGGSQSFLTDTVSIYNAPSCGSRTRGALQVQSVNNLNNVLFPLTSGEVATFGTDYTITMLMRFAGTTATWQRILNNGSASDIGFYATTSGVSFWPATGSIASGVFSTSAYSWITVSYQASTGNFDIYQNGVYLTSQNVSSYAAQANMQAPGMMFLQDDNITVENSPSTWLSYIHVSNAYVSNRTTSNSIFSEFMTYGCNLNSYYWDGSGSTNDSVVAGGTGAWTSAGTNWTDTTGSFNGTWGAAATAYFTNTAGTATIASGYSPSVGALNFASTGYTVAATGTGTISLAGTTNTITTPTGGIATISAPLAGGATNALNTAGTGTLYLTGTNTYTGATTVGAGTLSIGNGSTTGDISTTSAVSVATGATLGFNRSNAHSFAKVISGGGAVNQAGGGTTTLGVANTYTGATTVTAGTLQLGVNNAVPTGSAVSVSSGATLNLAGFSQSTSGLTVNGTLALGTNGSLTLTGGTNTVAAITGSGTITVNSGATLTLTGAISNSSVNIVLAGGTLNPGALTHSLGTLSLTANSTVDFSSNASLTVATLTPGTFTLNASGWVSGSGHFYATAVTGTPANNTASISPLNQITLGSNAASQTYWSSTANEFLIAAGTYTYWDTTVANSAVNGGTGSWDATTPNWTTSGGTPNGVWAGGTNTPIFQGTAGTATLANGYAASVGGLTFNTTGYTIAASGTGGLSLANTTNTVTTPTGGTATISAPIANGSGSTLTTAGTGTLVLTGDNTYTGSTTVASSGTLQIGNGGTTGSLTTGHVVANNGTLVFNRSDATTLAPVITNAASANTIFAGTGKVTLVGIGSIAGANSTVTINSGSTLQLCDGVSTTCQMGPPWIVINGELIYNIPSGSARSITKIYSGSGNFTLMGASDITLTGTSTYSGTTTLGTGTKLALGGGAGVGSIGSGTIVNNGQLFINRNNSITLANDISGTGSLVQGSSTAGVVNASAGTTILTGTNSYGTTTISAGTLQIGNGGTSGTLGGGAVTNNAALVFNRSDTLTTGNAISGTGSLTQAGTGTTMLSGANTYTGATAITAGTLSVGNGGASGDISTTSGVAVSSGATLRFNRTGSNTFGKVITGAGAVSNVASGTTVLSAANTYTGTTTVSAGTLQSGVANALPTGSAVTVSSGATLNLAGFSQSLAGLTDNGTLALGTDGSLTLTGGTSTIAAITGSGTITVNSGATLTLTGAVSNSNVNIVLAGGTLKPGTLTHSIGTLSLTANSTVDFSSNGSLTAATLTPGTFALNASGWVAGSGHLYATAVTGTPARDISGIAPLNQITLGSNAASKTYWSSTANELLAATGTYTYWDTSGGSGPVAGGTGSWDGTTSNWTLASGTPNGLWAGGTNTATFQGTAGTATIVNGYTASVGGLTFSTSGYTVAASGSGVLGLAGTTNTITTATGTATISAPITGGDLNALNTAGTGTLIIAGTHTYTGATTVGAGTLTLTGSLSSSSAVSVAAGATLAGTGTAAGSALVSGTLSPGNAGPGTLSTGPLVMAAGAAMAIELGAPGTTGGGVSDWVNVAGNVSLNGALTLSALSGFSSTGAYTILTYSGTRTGTFSSDNLAAMGYQGTIEYNDLLKQVNLVSLPRVRITEVSNGATGAFFFALTGLGASSTSLSTTSSGVGVSSAVYTGAISTASSMTQTAPAGWASTPTSGSCVDANGAGNGNGIGNIATLAGSTLTLSATAMRAGADITCTFTNTLNGISGYVFNDSGAPTAGANTGTPNDGIQNGAEAGLSGIAVSLTNCAGTTYVTTTTDGAGAYGIAVPAAQAGQAVCVTATLPAGFMATGANAAGTALPSAIPTSVGGTSYTFSRSGEQVGFTAPSSGAVTLNFGQVPVSTLVMNSVKQGAPGTVANHRTHVFTAGTGGSLQLSVSAGTATPAGYAWSEVVYVDPSCSGVMQAGLTKVTSPSVAVTVTQGQIVCLILQEFIPASAPAGASNSVQLQATLTLGNANPALTATYSVTDITSANIGSLQVQKAVRNVTQGGSFGSSNQAKPGDTLEYQITYMNLGAASISGLEIADYVSSFASFVSATADALPASLTGCAKNSPINPAPGAGVSCTATQATGGSGSVSWKFTGTLAPGASGIVRLSVVVN